MASTAVSAMPHNLHHIPLPSVPRIRPPRLMPGTVSPNTDPQPTGSIPQNSVWVQGKWRNPSSNAAKHQRHIVSAQVQKALRHHKHGMHIFAYFHIRTHQVVYSLDRVLDESSIMSQLLFHGKKTKPAGYRRDHWRPYFSLHFPQTPAGQRAGLTAFQRLREFAVRRQLSPDTETIRNKQEDVDAWFEGKSPVDAYMRMMDQKARPPKIGRIMGLGVRAKRLMEQKASSVADTALVLKLAVEQMQSLTKEDLRDRTRERLKYELGWRGRKRLISLRKEEEAKKRTLEERAKIVEDPKGKTGGVGLTKEVAMQVAEEYGGIVKGRSVGNKVTSIEEFEAEKESLEDYEKKLADIEKEEGEEDKQELQNKLSEVQVLWADMRDGTYAEEWPETVVHADMVSGALKNSSGNLTWDPHIAARDGTPEKADLNARREYWDRVRKEIGTARQEAAQLQRDLKTLKKDQHAEVDLDVKARGISHEQAIDAYSKRILASESALTTAQGDYQDAKERLHGGLQAVKTALEEAEQFQKDGKKTKVQEAEKKARNLFMFSDFVVPEEAPSAQAKPAGRARRGEAEEDDEDEKPPTIWSRVRGVFRRG